MFDLVFLLQVVHLLSQVEAQKLEVVRKEEELNLMNQRSRRDQEALQEARAQLERLEAQMSEVQEQLEKEMERKKNLEKEKERLEERLNQFREQRGGDGSVQADGQTVRIKYQSLFTDNLSVTFSILLLFFLCESLKLCFYLNSRPSGTASPRTAPKTGCSSRGVEMFRQQAPALPPTWTLSLQQVALADHTRVRGAQSTKSWANSTSFPQRSAAWPARPVAGNNKPLQSVFSLEQ